MKPGATLLPAVWMQHRGVCRSGIAERGLRRKVDTFLRDSSGIVRDHILCGGTLLRYTHLEKFTNPKVNLLK